MLCLPPGALVGPGARARTEHTFNGGASVERRKLSVTARKESFSIIYRPTVHSVATEQSVGAADVTRRFAT